MFGKTLLLFHSAAFKIISIVSLPDFYTLVTEGHRYVAHCQLIEVCLVNSAACMVIDGAQNIRKFSLLLEVLKQT